MGGLAGGLEEALSRELGKWSLKTTPCLRAVLDELDMALPGTFGIDLGEELCGDIGPSAWLTAAPGTGVPGSPWLFVPVASCAPYSVGSGVTARTVAWALVGFPGRYVVLRRLPADVLRATPPEES